MYYLCIGFENSFNPNNLNFINMNTNDYFNEPLKVQFTMSELIEIASALATESFSESAEGRKNNAARAWELREKVHSYANHYNAIYK